MKKIIALMLALMTVFAFVSCGGDDEGEGADSQQKAYVYSVKIMAGTTPIVGAKVDLRNESAGYECKYRHKRKHKCYNFFHIFSPKSLKSIYPCIIS